MKLGRDHQQYSPKLLALCSAAEQHPSTIAGLPDSCRLQDKAIDEALRAEKTGAPMPAVMVHVVCVERDLRLTIRRVQANLRWADIHLQRLQDERNKLAAVLAE